MKKSFSLSVFVFLIATMMLSFSIDHHGLSLLDIQKASAFISREGTPPLPQLSTSLPLPIITGSDIGMSGPTPSPLQQPSNIGNNDNANPLIQPNSIKGATPDEKISKQYIVVLKPSVSVKAESVAAEVKSKGADTIHIYNHAIKGFAIRVPNEHSLAAIENNPGVEFVEPDQKMTIFSQVLPTGVARVDGAPSSTKYRDGTGTANTGIAIIDTGIDLTHPDLNVYRNTTFVPGTISGNDDNGHGTHVAGIAAAKNNNIGVVGVAPGARLWAVKVLDSAGFGAISNIIAGIDYVTQHANEIGVANLSFGCQCHSNALDTALHNSVAAGITYVVAAGNSASNAIDFSPANNPDVIAVSAIVDTDGRCG
ncbi:MAG TPA: S8 family serine peptidase, partial [Nitrososphaeraceae archaeon]|nr:S8 family serine peptidase [Nitrososphaeraceae archaeon]